jgi:hypothetical protein
MNQTDMICQAIEQMRVIEFRYKASWRSAEPHTVGYNNRSVLTLCAWQRSGGSGQSWRDFHVNLMSDLIVTDESFDGPREGYNPSDSTLSNVLCTL